MKLKAKKQKIINITVDGGKRVRAVEIGPEEVHRCKHNGYRIYYKFANNTPWSLLLADRVSASNGFAKTIRYARSLTIPGTRSDAVNRKAEKQAEAKPAQQYIKNNEQDAAIITALNYCREHGVKIWRSPKKDKQTFGNVSARMWTLIRDGEPFDTTKYDYQCGEGGTDMGDPITYAAKHKAEKRALELSSEDKKAMLERLYKSGATIWACPNGMHHWFRVTAGRRFVPDGYQYRIGETPDRSVTLDEYINAEKMLYDSVREGIEGVIGRGMKNTINYAEIDEEFAVALAGHLIDIGRMDAEVVERFRKLHSTKEYPKRKFRPFKDAAEAMIVLAMLKDAAWYNKDGDLQTIAILTDGDYQYPVATLKGSDATCYTLKQAFDLFVDREGQPFGVDCTDEIGEEG